jgi:hypothetical protein
VELTDKTTVTGHDADLNVPAYTHTWKTPFTLYNNPHLTHKQNENAGSVITIVTETMTERVHRRLVPVDALLHPPEPVVGLTAAERAYFLQDNGFMEPSVQKWLDDKGHRIKMLETPCAAILLFFGILFAMA